MDLRQFEIFCRVYKERSFSRAARDLGLTQPTVSAHIKELEESLGTPVFNRLGREIRPTDAGRFLYDHAKSILSLKRNVMEKMAGFLNRIEGNLTVGASSVPGEYLLPGLITAFHQEHPGVRARLRISDSAETIDDLRHGEVELGVVGATAPDEDLVFDPFVDDRLVLAVPRTAGWKGKTGFTLRELRELPLLVREIGSGTRTVLEQALAKHNLSLADLNVAAELGSLGAIREAVKHGHGVAFMSELTVASECEAGTIELAQVRGMGAIGRTYYTVVSQRRVLSPLTRAFREYLRQASTSTRSASAPRPRRARRGAAR